MKSLTTIVRELDKNYLTEDDIKRICMKAIRQYKGMNTSSMIMMTEIIQKVLLKEKKDILNIIKEDLILYETLSKSIKCIENSTKYTDEEKDKIVKSINYKNIDKFLMRNDITFTRHNIHRLDDSYDILYIIQMCTSYVKFRLSYRSTLPEFKVEYFTFADNGKLHLDIPPYSQSIKNELDSCNNKDEFVSYFGDAL